MWIIIVFLFLFCLFPRLSEAKEISNIIGDTFEEISGKGLEIRTNPSAVKVFIDGAERGVTPISFDSIASGEHQIKLSKDGYKDRIFNVVLFNTSRLVVSIEMKEEQGSVKVSVSKAQDSPEQLPFHARISSETQFYTLPSDNTILLNLPIGYRTIRARAFGWEDASVTVLIEEDKTASVNIIMRPAELKIKNISASKRRFNPEISGGMGVIVYSFEVSAPCEGNFYVYDKSGNLVYQEELKEFTSWEQSVTWNGRDSSGNILPEGVYTVSIEVSALQTSSRNEEPVKVSLGAEINCSINIFPLSTESVVSGLAFTPMPDTLPKGSYQFEAGLFYNNFPAVGSEGGVVSSLPFKISMRVSPANKLELTSAFNINPLSENQTGWGVSGSVKINILDGGAIPFTMSAAASYSWAGKNGETPLSSGRGVGLYLPFSLELFSFSLTLSPAAFWRGPQGITPEFFLSSGIMYKGSWFNVGISERQEFNFADKSDKFKTSRIFLGAQAYFFPPPSIFYISLQAGGILIQENRSGFYGGLGLGIVY